MTTRELPEGTITLTDGTHLRQRIDAGLYVHAGARAWQSKNGLRVIAGLEPYLDGRFGLLLHVSLSRAERLPGWKEVKLIKDAFFGDDGEAMIVLPKAADYVNVHPHTHHLWQMPEPWTDVGEVVR